MSAELIAVTYDWKAAATRADANGRPDWAYGLRTGCSWPIPVGDTSPPPLEPKGTADVRSICIVHWCHKFCYLAARN